MSATTRRGSGGDEEVIINTIEEPNAAPETRRSPKPASKPGRVPPPSTTLPREVNTLTADEDSEHETLKAVSDATPTIAGGATYTSNDETVIDMPAFRKPTFDPIGAAARHAMRQRANRFAWTVILLVAGVVTLATVVQILPLLAIFVCWGLVLFLGGSTKDAIASCVVTVLTLRLWAEIAAIAFLILCTLVTSGAVWQWCVTAAIVVCLLHRLTFSIQTAVAKRNMTVVEITED